MIRYTDEHVWIQTNEETGTDLVATIGITVHAQDTLGDIVFVDLPSIGKAIAAKEVAGVVESVKAAADVFMPASGEVIELNEALRADPSLANSDPLNSGWFFKARLTQSSELSSLMDDSAYAAFCNSL